MKVYTVDNENGTSITVVAPNKVEARRMLIDQTSPLWVELRKTQFTLDYPFTTRSPCEEVKMVSGTVLGVITY